MDGRTAPERVYAYGRVGSTPTGILANPAGTAEANHAAALRLARQMASGIPGPGQVRGSLGGARPLGPWRAWIRRGGRGGRGRFGYATWRGRGGGVHGRDILVRVRHAAGRGAYALLSPATWRFGRPGRELGRRGAWDPETVSM